MLQMRNISRCQATASSLQRGKRFLPKCALFQDLAGNDQDKKVKEEKHLVCNQSPITVCQQENSCEMSFSRLVWPVSKPVRLKSFK